MEILGIGPMELLLILVIALIVMGPNDMVKTGRTIGKFLRQIVKSPTWQAVQQTSRDLRYLPNKLMREAGMEEEVEQLKEIGKNVNAMGSMQTSLQDEISKVNQEIAADWQRSVCLDHLARGSRLGCLPCTSPGRQPVIRLSNHPNPVAPPPSIAKPTHRNNRLTTLPDYA